MNTGIMWLAWREILYEALADARVQENVSPSWLVNPETGRRLSLDLYYPELALAVQFVGSQPAARRRRLSDQEVDAARRREQARMAVCEAHGVTLVAVNLAASEPRKELERLYQRLGTAMRRLAHAQNVPHDEKVRRMDQLARARQRLLDLRDRVRRPEDLRVFADKWRDRETRAQRAARREVRQAAPSALALTPGMTVQHPHFGQGIVVDVVPEENGDQRIVVDFPTGGRRTFLASLVQDKLTPVS